MTLKSSEMVKKSPETHLQEYVGILLLAVSALLFVSLLSYDPHDPSLVSLSSNPAVHNLSGKVGALVADLLFQGIGGGAYLLPLGALILGWRSVLRRPGGISPKAGLGFFFLLVFIPALMDLWFSAIPSPVGGWILQDHPGGIAGRLTNSFLTDYFNPLGAQIIILAGLLSALMVVSSLSLIGLSRVIGRGTRHLFSAARVAVMISREQSRRWQSRVRIQNRVPRYRPNILKPAPARIKPEPRPPAKPKQQKFEFMRSTGDYQPPPIGLLSDPARDRAKTSEEELLANSRILEKKLADFNIEGRVTQVHPGPVITLYEFEPAPGIKVNQIVNLSDDLALAMRAMRVRIVAPIPGKAVVGIEIPNNRREDVCLKEVLATVTPDNRPRLPLALGKDIFGNPIITDLSTMPHLLVAGTTGSGKSVALNAMILSLLFSATPEEVKFILIDPKLLELSAYEGIPHLLAPVVVKAKETPAVFSHLVNEMQNRYRLLAEAGVRNIEGYNNRIRERRAREKSPRKPESAVAASDLNPEDRSAAEPSTLPYLVVVVDELADLMAVASREVEDSIARLAQMARAAGIHLVVATQRPSVDVLTGIIKANFPARIAFQVSSKTDSRTILDSNGAEQLLGRGDMLFQTPGAAGLIRIHGAYVSEAETRSVVDFVKEQGRPQYVTFAPSAGIAGGADGPGGIERDELYEKATELVVHSGVASASLIQRRLRVGYPRAARMIEMMEEDGIVGPASGGKPREVLANRLEQENGI
jgi:S-DNA-T family DNA segregation ATPase FtsK/SpoIIIE